MKGIKEIFVKNKIKPYLTYSQKGIIWRMHFSPVEILVCETRDLAVKETYFFSLNYKTKQVFLSNFQIDEKWWISVESVSDESIFFNSFKTPELPEHMGITAVDVKTGRVRWKNEDLTFLFAESDELYAYKEHFEREIYYKLNSSNGEVLEIYEDENIADSLLELKRFNEEKMFAGFTYPKIYIERNESDEKSEKYFKKRLKEVKYFGELEYINYNDLLIYNFHADRGVNLKDITAHNLSNLLEIYNTNSERIIHDEILNSDALNYVPDSFFIKDGLLFYIKEKKELTLIDLNKLT
jgi:hypothetical protein